MDCQEAATPDPVDLLRDDEQASGLATLTLEIEAFEQRRGGSHFCLAAQVDGQRVGFALLLRPSSLPGVPLPGHDLELHRCEVQIASTGEESDRFVAATAAVYGIEAEAGRMLKELWFDALCLAGDPSRPQLGPVQLVLMYAGGDARRGQAFQWFLRIDVTLGEAGFVDQAPESHAAIVAALSAGPAWRH